MALFGQALFALILLLAMSAFYVNHQNEQARSEYKNKLSSWNEKDLVQLITTQNKAAHGMIVHDETLRSQKLLKVLEYFMFGTCENALREQRMSKVILAIHGNGCTGYMFSSYEDMALKNNICIIAPTIPGWGLSLSLHAVTIEEFSKLMKQLLVDELKIVTQFNVLGASMGAPYAAGVSAFLSTFVRNVNLFAPFGKKAIDNEPFGELNAFQKAAYQLLLSSYTRDFLVDWILMPMVLKDPAQTFESMYPHEYSSLKGTTHAKLLIDEMKRSVNWTSVGMKESSAVLLNEEWGFELDSICNVSGKIIVSMAEKDTMISKNNPHYYMKKIANSQKQAKLEVLKNRTHFSSVLDLEKALLALVE
ncbi:hypothetical protein C9374_000955 [Naegleria lovaniensis]|uniref:AB hydrolase-1 domain-containing protein n=1 Tax=Naegleria lovaniensis TaxID=51637 RepID=A0AA88KLP7_NAELO|nr:uncharacterized protein C9374_000955 [Naegleria lovaniensis]KAG2388105.1 hypothetical protein C9374_000955 [Naegleria lovaniensis]